MHHSLQRGLAIAIVALGLFQANRSSANLIVNGSFEVSNIGAGTFAILPSITGWTSTMGGGIEIQNHVAGLSYLGARHVELDSTSNSNMRQFAATALGSVYHLSFAYSARPGRKAADNSIEGYFNGGLLTTLMANGIGLENTNWRVFNFNVTGAAGSSVLEFRAVGPSNSYGGYLDGVSLAAVAEPPGLLLFAMGLRTMVRRLWRLTRSLKRLLS